MSWPRWFLCFTVFLKAFPTLLLWQVWESGLPAAVMSDVDDVPPSREGTSFGMSPTSTRLQRPSPPSAPMIQALVKARPTPRSSAVPSTSPSVDSGHQEERQKDILERIRWQNDTPATSLPWRLPTSPEQPSWTAQIFMKWSSESWDQFGGRIERTDTHPEIIKDWMHRLMVVQIREDKEACQVLLRRGKSMRMCPLSLRMTGAGQVVHYRDLWQHLDCVGLARDLEEQFKKRCNLKHTSGEFPAGMPKPWNGRRVVDFNSDVKSIVKELDTFRLVDFDGTPEWTVHLAHVMVGLGFKRVRELEGVTTEMAAGFGGQDPLIRSAAVQVVERVNAKTLKNRQAKLGEVTMAAKPGSDQASCAKFADSLKVEHLAVMEADIEAAFGNAQVDLGAKPGSLVQQMLMVSDAGDKEVMKDALAQRAQVLQLETNRKSLASMASGLKCWHTFAVGVLEMPEDATLPPQSDSDILLWLCIFKNPGTARNYKSFVRFACSTLGLDVSWDTERVKQVLKGLSKEHLRLRMPDLPIKVRITPQQMAAVIHLAIQSGDADFALAGSMAWYFLFRVQSECIQLQAGEPEHYVTLPDNHHSAVFIDARQQLRVRLRSRKNKPAGSQLMRPCTCQMQDELVPCPVHLAMPRLKLLAPGDRLFPENFTAAVMVAKLRRYMTLLMIDGSAMRSLKAFRSGRADCLARRGTPLPELLSAGEWRSRAVLNYTAEDSFAVGAVMAMTLREDAVEFDEE